MSYLFGILGIGLLFGLFAALHLWRGDADATSCADNGYCRNFHQNRERESPATDS